MTCRRFWFMLLTIYSQFGVAKMQLPSFILPIDIDHINHEDLDLILTIAISVLVILLLLIAALVFYNFQIRKRTKAMTATINELMYYRDVVLHHNDQHPVEADDAKAVPQDEKQRFKEMDRRIMQEELFRHPDFGRDDLMRMMGVDKNAISSIVQKYAHTNVAGYVKMKRMESAVNLLKEHPDLTIAAIAEMVGIKSTTTFVNHFKDTYGLTPSDYRNSVSNFTPPTTYNETRDER